MKQIKIWFLLILGMSSLLGCQGLLPEPARLEGTATAPVTLPPVMLPAPTATGGVVAATATPLVQAENPVLTIWVDETSAAHRDVLASMGASFGDEAGVHVEIVTVRPDQLPQLIDTAVLSDTLPDLILHPVAYTGQWYEREIISAEAATAVVERLGRETFEAEALNLVGVEEGVAAVPSHGYKQIWIYRTDWWAERGLARPDDFESILRAAETTYFTPTLTAGVVIPTESDLMVTQYAFEHMAVANGCELVDEKGEVFLLHPACLAALDFYWELIHNYSPSDVQTDLTALNAYLAGRAGLILTTPAVLPAIAGEDPLYRPRCERCEDGYLAANTGVVTTLEGDGQFARPARFSETFYLSITATADEAAAIAFVEYWLGARYLDWLGVEPMRKVPLRRGTVAEPTLYVDGWRELPMVVGGEKRLVDVFGEEMVAELSADVAASERWGIRQGQGALVAKIYRERTIAILLQEMLSGYFTSSQTIVEAYVRVTNMIPFYAYYPPTRTPAPEGTVAP